MDNQYEIDKCVDLISRSEKLLNQLYQVKKKKNKKKNSNPAVGKMILMERNNIKVMKTKLILLGTTYELAIEKHQLTSAAAFEYGRRTGKTSFDFATKYRSFSPGITGTKARSIISDWSI